MILICNKENWRLIEQAMHEIIEQREAEGAYVEALHYQQAWDSIEKVRD